ncbi:MAG: glycosyltransferase family 39 protein, partial [Victivallales bacterium]|nr:glycosyltransferase family 39 protein [Victivallales bacterium]
MKKRYFPVLLAVFIALRLATLAVPPLTDPSEARYATLAKVMVTTGQWFAPKVWIDGRLIPFMGKPPLGFWMMAGAMKLFGCNEFAARLPSAVCCILLLALMFHILRRYSDSEVAWTALFVTASSACFFILSGATLVDAILALFSIGAVFLYYAFLKEQQRSAKKFWSAA